MSKSWDMQKWTGKIPEFHACFCIGPQDGEPLCPCRMRNLRVQNGRYVEVIDHGPAPKAQEEA